VFQELQFSSNSFDAVNFMTLGDLSDQFVGTVAGYYGLVTPEFKSALQTLGLFDGAGQPKPAWSVVACNVGVHLPEHRMTARSICTNKEPGLSARMRRRA
jgi:hypothetical protein